MGSRIKQAKIDLYKNPRIILITEKIDQTILIREKSVLTGLTHTTSELKIRKPGRYEICLCNYALLTLWLTRDGEIKTIKKGGIMSTFKKRRKGTKILIHHKDRVPTLKYLCHQAITSKMEEEADGWHPNLRKQILFQGTGDLIIFKRIQGLPFPTIFPACNCDRRKSLPEKIRKLRDNFKYGSRKFFLFIIFLFIFICE
jgi:hypothetical protein